MKPGGWIELCELDIYPVSIDGSPPESYSQILAFISTLNQAALGQGCDVQIAPKFKDLAIQAGYEDVTEEIFTVPWGSWPRDPRLKEVGAFLRGQHYPSGTKSLLQELTPHSGAPGRASRDLHGTIYPITRLDR